MGRSRWSVLVVGLLLVGAFTVSSEAQEPASIVVTPNNALHDGDVVTISGTDFPASSSVQFCEGIVTTGPPNPSNCGTTPHGVTTDSAGSFVTRLTVTRWFGLTSGVIVDCAEASATCGIGAQAFTSPGQPTSVVPITFAAGQPTPDPFRITGTVLDANGQPAPDSVLVEVMAPSDRWVAPGSRQAHPNGGQFAVEDIEAYTPYKVFVYGAPAGVPDRWLSPSSAHTTRDAATPFIFTTELPSANVEVRLDDSGAIAGVVTDEDGAPVPNVKVSAFLEFAWASSNVTTTATDGSYTVVRLPSDQWMELQFVPPASSGLMSEWFDDSPLRGKATPVHVLAGQPATADAVLTG